MHPYRVREAEAGSPSKSLLPPPSNIAATLSNNRLLEVTPDKRIVWEFPSPSLKIYRGNDDVNFAPDGKTMVVNEEDNFDLHMLDYETRRLMWSYGVPDTRGSGEGYLNFPDDARLLPDGRLMVADIRNCRLLFIDPKTRKMLTQWGKPGVCKHAPPATFAYPNDINYFDNGDFLVTEIPDAWISRLGPDGHVVWSIRGPHLHYPSDARAAADGNIIVADFVKATPRNCRFMKALGKSRNIWGCAIPTDS